MKAKSFKLVFYGTPLLIFIIRQCCIAQEGKKVCLGSGITTTSAESYNNDYWHLHNMYNACQIVLGNIDISYLESHHDLSFLKSIEEVGGYISLFSNKVTSIPLENLRVIRGNTLYQGRYALYISTGRGTYHNYQEIPMRNLTEILRGGVYIGRQPNLCFLETIKWNEIVNTNDANNTIDLAISFSECPPCDSQCGGKCWGPGPENCQKFTKHDCSPLCPHHCKGPSVSDCCDDQCASGCTGNTSTHCMACRTFYDGETCRESCPPLQIYKHYTYQVEANPHGMYSLQNYCFKECPHHFKHTEDGRCVLTCSPDSEEVEEHGVIFCRKHKGKVCSGIGTGDLKDAVSVNSLNIDSFKDCNKVLGNLVILPSASDSFNIHKSDYEKLRVFKSIREITGFLQIMWWPKQYSDLNPFENLEIIHGTTTFEGYSMIITRLSIHSLGLSSLKEIRNGNVLIKANKNLCYVDSINWRTILKTDQQKEIENNQSHEECAAADKMCDPLCSVGGCWGPGPFQCFSCHTFSLDGECLHPCSILERYPHREESDGECYTCHPECMIQPTWLTCAGPGADKCFRCAHYKDGPYCVKSCPEGLPGVNDTIIWKYPDEFGVCQLCHPDCTIGCEGPRFENCRFLGQKEKSAMKFRKPLSPQANVTCFKNEEVTFHQVVRKLDVLISNIHVLSSDLRFITYQQNFTTANIAAALSLLEQQNQLLSQQAVLKNENKTQWPKSSEEDWK